MAWIFLAGSVASRSHFDHGPSLSHIVSVKDTLKLCSCKGSKLEPYLTPRSGTTFAHSEARCLSALTSSTEDSPAKISALQVLEKAWAESAADLSGKFTDSRESADQLSFFSKTSRQSEPVALSTWSGHLPISGMTVDGLVYQPKRLEPRTSESGGSYLPTPTAQSYGTSNNGQRPDGSTFKLKGKMSLNTMARKGAWPRLPTPRPCSGLRSSGMNRTDIMEGLKRWPTPRVSDIRGEGAGAAGRRMAQGAGCTLAGAVKLWPTPTVRDSNTIAKVTRGANASRGGTPLPIAVGGTLNPQWVEWLMGYKIGYTDLEDWAIRWFRSKPKKRSRG